MAEKHLEAQRHDGTEPWLEFERFHTPTSQRHEPQQQQHSESTSRIGQPRGDEPQQEQLTQHHGTRNTDKRLHGPKLRKALAANLVRWFITAVFVVAIYIVLWYYSRQSVISPSTKREFNVLIIGLSLGLGLSITFSLEAMAKEIRWWILSLRDWPPCEAELILKAKDLNRIVQLTWVSHSFWIRSYAIAFILLNLVSQIGLATLGLTYATNPANNLAILKPGNVTIPDMSNLVADRVLSSKSQTLSALRYTANSYGSIALAWVWGSMEDIPKPGTLWDNNDPLIYCGGSSCRFVFQESSPNPNKYDLIVSTNRSVEAVGRCRSWKVTSGGSGNQSTITIADDSRSEVELMAVNGVDQTTFMFDASSDQGTTWSEVTAFEASTSNAWYYRCNVSFGPVINAARKEHELGVNITALASSSIALQGYGASSLSSSNSSQQFQSYPAESTYGEPQKGSVGGMGVLMAAFSVGAVAVASQASNGIVVQGLRPLNGVVLEISHWKFVHLILGLTLGVQLLLGVGIAILSNQG
ncbi:hypothetical protein FZEAL_7754 [Fusarium zealandicum]|uniref:Uncharacterized protein n=1 Tax=Fusarium zealandicum TaxID=1053134 RepID=A0A8H4XIC5_9HYPO|nr:hypothetical protein FZEAL_7754 [Fusarium zealandicum]